jgi:hypothetical protein
MALPSAATSVMVTCSKMGNGFLFLANVFYFIIFATQIYEFTIYQL